MTSLNGKTTASTVVCLCAETCITCACNITKGEKLKQPIPGTALTSFLKRHERELRAFHSTTGDKIALHHAEICAAILATVKL